MRNGLLPERPLPKSGTVRQAIALRGLVQGVGFRPYVYRLARELGVDGWVANTPDGVAIEAEASGTTLGRFLERLPAECPVGAAVVALETTVIVPGGPSGFAIRPSIETGLAGAYAPPDLAMCADCRRELLDAANRRHRYPFISCAQCGPRYSLIAALPYDRERTAMRGFGLCAACRAEYENPLDRRFHAETIACAACGPSLELMDTRGRELARGETALARVIEALQSGRVVALKGIGGFQLLVDARNPAAIERLRHAKARPAKPFAVMLPALQEVERLCQVDPVERTLLASAAAPIVLLRRSTASDELAPNVAPENPYLGVLLPYSPLHQLILQDFGAPLIATSGNRSEEPICLDTEEALRRLGGIADLFLSHDRPILRPLDDSLVRVIAGQPLVLRRARGYAPLPVQLRKTIPPSLAVGGHLKNTVAVSKGDRVILSQHLGDLDSPLTQRLARKSLRELCELFAVEPRWGAADGHPDYASAGTFGTASVPMVPVQHHHAHVLSCMAEHGLEGRVLGVAWDGLGMGLDGTLWGGEFLRVGPTGFERLAHIRPFRLPGGTKAVREPRRAALGLAFGAFGEAVLNRTDWAPVAAFPQAEREVLRRMLVRGINAPWCTSVGRLFDALASLLGLRQVNRFEGDAAMAVEFAAETSAVDTAYPFEILSRARGEPLWVDWGPMIRVLVEDVKACGAPDLARRFHRTLAEMLAAVACRLGERRIVLTGGCFQSRLLTEMCLARLELEGFEVFRHGRIPPNDGGLALGQILGAAERS